jgi:acetyltransferase-like isoleucine patch superfamily enzyme
MASLLHKRATPWGGCGSAAQAGSDIEGIPRLSRPASDPSPGGFVPGTFWQRAWLKVKRRAFVQGPVQIGANFHMGFGSFISSPHSLQIGDDVYVGKYCSIQCSGQIGNCVLIANNVGIVGRRDHDMKHMGMPVRYARSASECAELAAHPANAVAIEDDVWIGYGAIILSGVRIGRGAVIGAGAVVSEDVPCYAVMRGNPAVVAAYRFSPAEIELHERDAEKRGNQG